MCDSEFFKTLNARTNAKLDSFVQLIEQENQKILMQFKKSNELVDSLINKYKENGVKSKKLNEYSEELKSEVLNQKYELYELQSVKEDMKIKVDLKRKEVLKRCKDVPSERELEELKLKKASLEEDWKLKKEKMISEFKSYNCMVHYYKKFFGCYISLEEPNFVIFEFEKRLEHDTQSNYFVKLSTSDGETFSLVDIHPKLDCQDQLAERLQKTNNVTELLIILRKQLKPSMME